MNQDKERFRLHFFMSSTDLPRLVRQLAGQDWLGNNAPDILQVDSKERKAGSSWLSDWLPKCQDELIAKWEVEEGRQLWYYPQRIAGIQIQGYKDPHWLLEKISKLSFSVASFDTLYEEWFSIDPDYVPPTFSDMHLPHGWACTFKGAGHHRLVSRRWLNYGPWHVLTGENDTSLVLFHDMHASAQISLVQARPGHERMGITDTGGFIQSDYVYTYGIKGLYIPEERLLKIVVHGREISQLEMLDMCAARYNQALGPKQPVQRIAYIFMDEAEARSNLHELWLRELECWAIVNGQEQRLDAAYQPTPIKPTWITNAA